MFILVPAKGIFSCFVISKNTEKIKEHLNKEYKTKFIYEEHGTIENPNIFVYKDVSSPDLDDIRELLMNVEDGRILIGYIQNMNEYEV
jgi:hypothetical protein